MSYSNGRVYRELVSGQIRGAGIYDVMQALGTDINNVGGLCRLAAINPWAKFHPIPCMFAANNKPIPLTRAQRLEEQYGIDPPIDMFTADDIQAYKTYVDKIVKHGQYYIQMRPWGDTHFKRLDDFVDNAAYNVGYDHNAKPENKKITISGATGEANGIHSISPLITEVQRTIYIPAGSTNARFMFPVDHIWMDVYYQSVYGTTTANVHVDGNDEWLSPIDFMGKNTYYDPSYTPPQGQSIQSYASVVRRVIIFRWEDSQQHAEGDSGYNADDAEWRFYNYATDKITNTSSAWNTSNRPFSSYPQAWLDLTDSETAINTATNVGQRRLKDLVGRCLFIDCWVQENSYVNVFPIIGYSYEVNISRTNDTNVDVTGVISFSKVQRMSDTQQGAIWYYYYVIVAYDPEKITNLPMGLENAFQAITNALKVYYDSLSVNINGNQIDLFNSSSLNYNDYLTDWYGDGWYQMMLGCYKTTSNLDIQESTITAVRKNAGVNSYKLIPISDE